MVRTTRTHHTGGGFFGGFFGGVKRGTPDRISRRRTRFFPPALSIRSQPARLPGRYREAGRVSSHSGIDRQLAGHPWQNTLAMAQLALRIFDDLDGCLCIPGGGKPYSRLQERAIRVPDVALADSLFVALGVPRANHCRPGTFKANCRSARSNRIQLEHQLTSADRWHCRCDFDSGNPERGMEFSSADRVIMVWSNKLLSGKLR